MSGFKLVLITLIGIITLGMATIFMINTPQNKAITLEEKVSTAKSAITVQEKRRTELIPNLVDCVKQYDRHEYDTLMGVIKERGSNSDEVAQEVTTMINAVAEQSPELKSNDNYKNLMNELSTTENLIAQHRNAYDKSVENYNSYIRKFPARVFLSLTGYEKVEYNKLNFEGYEEAPSNLFGD